MSFLTPLYVLGVLAVVAPVVFHLIRRSPRGELPFSSLMFLGPTPPRLTRRSRIDQWLLLALRALALGLLALAFARPFLRQAALLALGESSRGRIAVLVDTSASLHRGDLWPRARALADEAIAACRPGDDIAVYAFDESLRPLLGFAESATLEPAKRQAIARARLAQLEPTWSATHLGQALVDAVAAVVEKGEARGQAGRVVRRLVLVSDLQAGSRLDPLGDFEWPADTELELRTVTDGGTNAGLQWLLDAPGTEPPDATAPLRVRVTNDPGALQDRFELRWIDAKASAPAPPVVVHVPPGESRVAHVALPPAGPTGHALRLSGDAHKFDDTIYLAADRKDEFRLIYLGNDAADDPAGLRYYLERVFPETRRRSVQVVAKRPSEALAWDASWSVPLVVLSGETPPASIDRLRSYLRDGGAVLYVLAAPGQAATLAALAGVPACTAENGPDRRDVLLGTIAFDHALFAPFAAAQFNDFTKIHFWKYRRLSATALGDAKVAARFETGDPAVLEKAVGKGRLIVFTSGWAPGDSQLARATKFVPLMTAVLEGPGGAKADTAAYRVNDRVPLPSAGEVSKGTVVRTPAGKAVAVAPGSTDFAATDAPGVYAFETPQGSRSFAVNLDPAESRTAPLQVETLEQFGCRLASRSKAQPDAEQLRQLQAVELESRQKIWRWLILSAIGVLIVETILAGRLSRRPPVHAEALSS